MLKHILERIPLHKVYVEPFGGSATVLFAKQPSEVEIYNDLDSALYNFFKVLRDKPDELYHLVQFTEYGRQVLKEAVDVYRNPQLYSDVKWAWSVFVVYNLSWCGRETLFMLHKNPRVIKHVVKKFNKRKNALMEMAQRLRNVIIENRDCHKVLDYWDSEDTLFYLDPPYLPQTRVVKKYYDYEMHEADHIKLLQHIKQLKGKVLLSGYDNPLYDEYLDGWYKMVISKYKRMTGLGSSTKHVHETLWWNYDIGNFSHPQPVIGFGGDSDVQSGTDEG